MLEKIWILFLIKFEHLNEGTISSPRPLVRLEMKLSSSCFHCCCLLVAGLPLCCSKQKCWLWSQKDNGSKNSWLEMTCYLDGWAGCRWGGWPLGRIAAWLGGGVVSRSLGWFIIGWHSHCFDLNSVHENHQTCQTFPMARPKCLLRDFTNLNRIHKAHQTNIWWTMKVFRLHCLNVYISSIAVHFAYFTFHQVIQIMPCKVQPLSKD